tara:strand:- start:57 stop:575 length:519 start_codon:yes stop_codon:yes gene_type:complete
MQIKLAETEREFEQIHALNYKIFVEEIPQHSVRKDKKLVDPFHKQNVYFIALFQGNLIGMVCYNCHRPYSLEKKKVNIDACISKGVKTAEIRLLAVEKKWRNSKLTYKLLKALIKDLILKEIHLGFISATTRQSDFYKKLGFTSFGNIVGKEGAFYQPMYIEVENLKRELHP